MRTPDFTFQWGVHLMNCIHPPFCLRRNSRVAVWNASVFPSASKPMILGELLGSNLVWESWLSDIPVRRHAIYETHDTGQNTYAEPLYQPRYIFHADANEKRGEILGCQRLDLRAIN